jgi:hypothetical protein
MVMLQGSVARVEALLKEVHALLGAGGAANRGVEVLPGQGVPKGAAGCDFGDGVPLAVKHDENGDYA